MCLSFRQDLIQHVTPFQFRTYPKSELFDLHLILIFPSSFIVKYLLKQSPLSSVTWAILAILFTNQPNSLIYDPLLIQNLAPSEISILTFRVLIFCISHTSTFNLSLSQLEVTAQQHRARQQMTYAHNN